MVATGASLLAKFYRTTTTHHENLWQGDEIPHDKDSQTVRLMFHNVNGINMRGNAGFDMFVNEQVHLQVDIQGFTEHCLDTTKFKIYQTATTILRRHASAQSSLQLHSSEEPALNNYKPGGTGILAIGPTVSRLEPQGRGGDSLGRWSYIHLHWQHQKPVTIITAYQVGPRPTNPIGNTAYHQQLRALSHAGRYNIHPRRAFICDLGSFLNRLQTLGHDIILGGDFNESLEDKNSGILQLASRYNLVDPFASRYPHHPAFGTHIMGSRRIDLILLTPALLPSFRHIGYAPFHYAHPSDHRPVLIEFHGPTLFGHNLDSLHTSLPRGIQSKDKKNVTRFITQWFQELQHRQAFTLQQYLEDDTATPAIVETLDAILGSTGDSAESSCKRRRPEFYSQTIVQQRFRVSILRSHLNSLRMGLDHSEQLHQRMSRTGIVAPLPLTQRGTLQALRQASTELQQTRQKSMDIRHAELCDKIEKAAQSRNKTREKILRSIKTVENNRHTYLILKAVKQHQSTQKKIDRIEIPASWPPRDTPITSINQLEDPKTCTEWRSVTDPTEVEYYLMMRNRLHFGQAEGTPFTRPPLQDDIDWAASTNQADELLEGTYPASPAISFPNCDDLLRACTSPTALDSIPSQISICEFREKIHRWRESTTTSPSGRHLGRYKALFATGNLEEDESADVSFRSMQESISALIVSILNYCIRHTYVLQRWRKIINVMIFKEHGNFKIHRLRIIHIYEADFNLLLAVKWRQLLRFADNEGLLNHGQYGGRPGCEAQSLTLLEELKYDLAYLTRRTLLHFDNDAASCYDRIVVPLASVINRKYGMHRKVVALHASTLQHAIFHLQTAAGISVTSYSHSSTFPIHGTGQGSANSPSIWLFISSTLFDLHQQKAYGAKFISPDGQYTVEFSMVGFVDDSTGTSNNFQAQSELPIQQLLEHMEHDAQLWNNLLYCSGGKLELKKCSFHVLSFTFRPNGQPLPSTDAYDHRIHVCDGETRDMIPIPSKRYFDCHKTLGHYKSPSSNRATELANVKEKAHQAAMLICLSPVTRQGAFLAYHTVYIPRIRYTLPQSFFSQKALDLAQAPSMHKLLSKCGYNRNTARALIYAPLQFAGGGFLPWHLLQGDGQVKHFIKHWRTNSLISRTLRVAISWAQWQSGHHQSILDDPLFPLPFLECRWISSLRNFLGHIQASIQTDGILPTAPETTNDIHIMTYAVQCGMFTDAELRIINYCRLYLHVATVSELFNASGTTIIRELFECRREPWFNPATVITLQSRPSQYQIWFTWQKLCRQWSLDSGSIAASLQLGRWQTPGHPLRCRRQTYLEIPTRNVLYHWRDGQYWEYHRDPSQQHLYLPQRPTTWQPIVQCHPVDAFLQGNGIVCSHPKSRILLSEVIPNPASFSAYVSTLEPWEQQLLQGIALRCQPYEILASLRSISSQGYALLVSDGSVASNRLSFGWVFGTSSNNILATHSGSGFGEPTSHRAESWGLLAGTLFVHHILRLTLQSDLLAGLKIHLVCDNQSLITRLNSRLQYTDAFPNATLAPDWDTTEQIITLFLTLPLTAKEFQWVKGHQDPTAKDLSVEATFNILADSLAGTCHDSACTFPSQEIPMLPAARCQLKIQGQTISSHHTSAIRLAYTTPALYQYLEQRHRWSPQLRQQVDWKVFERAVSCSAIPPVQLFKLVHDKLPTNSEIAKSNPHHPPTCQFCSERQTFHHLIVCPNPRSQEMRQDLSDLTDQYLSRQWVSPSFRLAWQFCLAQSITPQTMLPKVPTIREMQPCIQDQLDLHLPLFLRGFWTKKWRQSYETHHRKYSMETPNDSIEVLAGLLVIIWKRLLAMWHSHQSHLHQSQLISQDHASSKIAMYKSKIRLLHSQRDQCLHGHRDLYFYPDVEDFLNSATGTQMRNYLHHYETAIRTSIHTAAHQPRRTIFTFAGFTRHPRHPNMNRSLPMPAIIRQSHTSDPSEPSGEPNNRKQTRWRQPVALGQSLRRYFAPKPP